jgi:predicted site-specific integrase-resolvase
MKLSQWAKKQGISYITAYRWFKDGKISNASQLENGTILVDDKNVNLTNAEEKLRKILEILNE